MARAIGNTDIEYELAISQGKNRKICALIKKKIKPPKCMMLFALVRKHPELLTTLSEAGADANDADRFGERALGHAVNYFSIEVVRTLLDVGADPNKESLALLPLIWAAYDEKIDCVRALLKAGANPNLAQRNGVTPLHAAARNGQPEIVKLLLENGAKPEIEGLDGRSAFELAMVEAHHDVASLLKAFNQKSIKGHSQSKIFDEILEAIQNDDAASFEKNISLKTDLNERDKMGRSLLDMAINVGSEK